MDEKVQKDDLVEIENIEVEPLSDDALESVDGGLALSSGGCCSCNVCSLDDINKGTGTD